MSKQTLIAAAVGTAFAAGLAAAPIAAAAENPFALSGLSSGYQVADAATPGKPMEGKYGCMYMKAGEGQCGMSMADTDNDGKVSKEEAAKHHETMFTQVDANKDGFVDKTEMGKMWEGKCGEKMRQGMCGGTK